MSSAPLLNQLCKYLDVLASQYLEVNTGRASIALYKGQETSRILPVCVNRQKKTKIVLCFFYFCISTCQTAEMILMLLNVLKSESYICKNRKRERNTELLHYVIMILPLQEHIYPLFLFLKFWNR